MSRRHEETVEAISRAAEEQAPIRIYRDDIEDGSFVGYVFRLGAEFFGIEVIGDAIRFDGCSCIRFVDVTDFDFPYPHAGFVEKALALKGQVRKGEFEVDLSSAATILDSLAANDSIVTIHAEIIDPDGCDIGRIVDVKGGQVELLSITPDGEWDADTLSVFLGDITRIDFGGEYEKSLLLVAGEPPKLWRPVSLRVVSEDD